MNRIFVTGQTAKVVERDPLVSGSVGTPFVAEFAEDWDGYSKTLCFKTGHVQMDVVNVGMNDQIEIPHEVLAVPFERVKVGVYGTKGDLAKPIIWLNLDDVMEGTTTGGGESTDPSLPVWAQIIEMIGALSALQTNNKTNLVMAINEVLSRIITKHSELEGRDDPDQHPIEAVTGLTEALNTLEGAIVTEHGSLSGRDIPGQHPIAAITGLQKALDDKQPVGEYLTEELDPGIPIHNTDSNSHADIRLLIKGINDRLNAFFDSDDQTLDELSEIVKYITDNKTLIDSITTSKVNVSDIVNNLITNSADKPLSAAQGLLLNQLITNVKKLATMHIQNGTIHVEQADKDKWNSIVPYEATSDGTPPENLDIFWEDDSEDASNAADIVIDPTLKMEWAAAEAKMTGIQLEKLNTEKASLEQLSEHNTNPEAHNDIRSLAAEAKRIAAGRNFAEVFETKSAMNTWLADPDNTKTLEVGTNLYIKDLNVPDYWWDGVEAQELEVEHPDLSSYATKVELSMSLPMVLEETQYIQLESEGKLVPGRIYHVVPDGYLAGGASNG